MEEIRHSCDRTEAAGHRDDGRPLLSALEARRAAIPEWVVALAHRLAEAGFGGALLERVALGRVASDTVEDGAQDLRGVQALDIAPG